MLIIRGLIFAFLFNSAHIFDRRKRHSTIEQQKFKDHEKRDWLLVSKMDLNFSDFTAE